MNSTIGFSVTQNIDKAICVVDDDYAVRDSLKVMLESCGLRVRDFASARDFLECADYRDCPCLILDLHMPVMSGLELLESLRAQNVAIPAVMVTGRPEPLLATRLENAGLAVVLAKPVHDGELLDRIARAISSAQH
jgi:two-component system response regulator FixJ